MQMCCKSHKGTIAAHWSVSHAWDGVVQSIGEPILVACQLEPLGTLKFSEGILRSTNFRRRQTCYFRLLRLQSSEVEPVCRSLCRRRSCTLTEVARLVPSSWWFWELSPSHRSLRKSPRFSANLRNSKKEKRNVAIQNLRFELARAGLSLCHVRD